MQLPEILDSIQVDFERTWGRFQELRVNAIAEHPIPFFGPASNAQVLTVGVNPSATEFVDRHWPAQLSPEDLQARLTGYFTAAPCSPHLWFSRWQESLSVLGLTYGRDVAHVDLSPRPTKAMQTCSQMLFCSMVEHDAQWFFKLLPFWTKVRLLLLAGCVTNRYYLHEFLAHIAPGYGYSISPKPLRGGRGRIGYHLLSGHGRQIPFFFCSVSPSATNWQLLTQRTTENHDQLSALLK